jgi:tRNA(fMet)-specific endonuclease VapC
VRYLLDSNIIIRMTLGHGDKIRARAGSCAEGDIVTSAIAYAEVAYGSTNGKLPAIDQLRAFVEEVPVLAFDYKAAQCYSTLPFRRASYDRLIGAHALSEDLILVTENVADFADMPGLRVEDWTV